METSEHQTCPDPPSRIRKPLDHRNPGHAMALLKSAFLPDRGVVSIVGSDAQAFLQGIITNDMDLLAAQQAIYAGLLTPQGKILFDFFVIKTEDGYLLEAPRNQISMLIQRLNLYKLRSKAEITDCSAEYTVTAIWGDGTDAMPKDGSVVAFLDPRLPELGFRLLLTLENDRIPAEIAADPATREDYDAHRIALGVPEGGKDYEFGDAFPHEALFDQLNGVSFSKGCFVGQEVVSRMQHRGTARKRIVPVVADGYLPDPGSEVRAGTAAIGTLASTSGNRALALLRIDRAAEAASKGEPLLSGNAPVRIDLPVWATFKIAASAD